MTKPATHVARVAFASATLIATALLSPLAADPTVQGATPATAVPMKAPPIGTKVPFAGCVKAGVEAGCLAIESGGNTYDVTPAKAQLTVREFFAGTGEVSGEMTTCQQGVRLKNIVLDDPQPVHVECLKAAPAETRSQN